MAITGMAPSQADVEDLLWVFRDQPAGSGTGLAGWKPVPRPGRISGGMIAERGRGTKSPRGLVSRAA